MIRGNHPINILGNQKSRVNYVNETVYCEIKNYFSSVAIYERRLDNGLHIRTSIVPFITLFTNKEYRDAYLDYTKNTSDKYTLRLRKILLDDNSRKNHYVLMIEKIGDTLVKYNVDTFQLTTLEFTTKTRATDGKRQRYYLNVKGIKCEDKNVKDLSDLYLQIKDFRNRTKDVSKKNLSKNA